MRCIKPAFHNADTDFLARILADSPEPRRRPRENHQDDVGEDVGVVECQLYTAVLRAMTLSTVTYGAESSGVNEC